MQISNCKNVLNVSEKSMIKRRLYIIENLNKLCAKKVIFFKTKTPDFLLYEIRQYQSKTIGLSKYLKVQQ